MQRGLRVELVGRERERSELTIALENAAAGRGAVVLLLGEAGMGKSTLASWIVAYAFQAEMTVAQGGCSAAGMPVLWPVRRALAHIAPELRWRDDSGGAAGSDRELLVAGVVEAIARASHDRPLVIVLEDLHWADAASLLVIRAVASAVQTLPVLLVLTMRDDPGDQPPEGHGVLGKLPTHAIRLALPPLDLDGVAALATQALDHELTRQDIRALHDRTGGNPFFVREVLRLQAAHGAQAAFVVPPGVAEVIQQRVARVSQGSAALLAIAAVASESCGDLIEDDLVVDDAGDPRRLDEAVAARLIDHVPPNHAFRHSLIREVIEDGLSAAERARLHAVVADRLEHRKGARASPARLAHHWMRAGAQERERAAHWSLLAARSAVSEFGFESAVDHFRRALTGVRDDRIAVSIELGEALQLCGETAAARDVLCSAADDAERIGQPVDLARAALALGGGLAGFEVPVADEVQSTLLARADQLLPETEVAWRAAVRGRLSLAHSGAMSSEERIALAENAVRLARDAGDPAVESAVLAAYCDAIAGPDFVSERVAAASRMVALTESGTSFRDRATLLLARRLLLVACIERGDLGAAETHATAYERVARRLGIPLYGWLPEIWRGMRALLVGDVAGALRHAEAADRIGRQADSFNAELMVFTLRLQAHLDRNTPQDFVATARDALDRIVPSGMPAMYLAGPAKLLLAAGDPSAARSALRAFATGDADTMPKDAEWLESHWALADIAIALDDRPAAERLYAALRPYAHLWAVDGIGGAVFGAIDEVLGRLAAHLGRSDEAAEHLAAARARYEQQGTPALLHRLPDADSVSTAAARIHHEGSTWQLDWRGRRTVVRDAKGLRDLRVLLTRPGQAIPALTLVEAAGGPAETSVGGGLGPVLDDQARRAYRHRLDELERDLDEAQDDADLARADRIRSERDLLVSELAAAVGLGGRARIAGDPADRARKAVTMRIRAAIRTIAEHDAALGRHLSNAVQTGRLCSYQPETSMHWET